MFLGGDGGGTGGGDGGDCDNSSMGFEREEEVEEDKVTQSLLEISVFIRVRDIRRQPQTGRPNKTNKKNTMHSLIVCVCV